MKVLSRNILATHHAYPKIIDRYNLELKEKGKVNAKKFYEDVILAEIPDYSLMSWYQFLRRLKTAYGVGPVEVISPASEPGTSADLAERSAAMTLISNDEATRKLIQGILNISAQATAEMLSDPNNIPSDSWKKIELGLKAMKAQDSRIHAIGKIREDKREQDKFDRAFDTAIA